MTIQPDYDLANKVLGFIGAGVGVIVTLTYAIKAAIPKIARGWVMLKEMKQVIEQLPVFMETSRDIEKVKSEVSVNGGASMKDAVLRIEAATLRHEQAILDLRRTVAKNEVVLSRFAAKQTQVWNNASVFLFYMDEHGLVTEMNDALLDFIDRDKHEMLRMGWVTVLAVDKRRQAYEEWDAAVRQRRTFELETVFLIKGQLIPVLIRAVPMTLDDGTISGYDGNVRTFKT